MPVKVADGIVGISISRLNGSSFGLLRPVNDGEYHSLALLARFVDDTPLTKKERKAVRETMMTALQASICCQKRIQEVSQTASDRMLALLMKAMIAIDKFRHRKTPRPIF